MVITSVIPPTHWVTNNECCSDTHSWCPTAPLPVPHVSVRLVLSLFYFVFNFISERKKERKKELHWVGEPDNGGLDIITSSSSSALIYTTTGLWRAEYKYPLHCPASHCYTHLAIFVITNTNHYHSAAPPILNRYSKVCWLHQWLLFRVELPHTF